MFRGILWVDNALPLLSYSLFASKINSYCELDGMAEDDSREDDSGDTSLDELWWSMNISDEYGSNDTN